jgi:hypothetical protein
MPTRADDELEIMRLLARLAQAVDDRDADASRAALVSGVASVLGDAKAGRAEGANLRASVLEACNRGLREQVRSQMFPSSGDTPDGEPGGTRAT